MKKEEQNRIITKKSIQVAKIKQQKNALSLLTTNREGAARQHVAQVVFQSVVALICLSHSLCHPDLTPTQQPSPAHFARFRVRPVPQHDGNGLGWHTPRGKLQYRAILRNVVLKVLPIVPAV